MVGYTGVEQGLIDIKNYSLNIGYGNHAVIVAAGCALYTERTNGGTRMKLPFIKPVYAHCDLPCGVYDPQQALIEAKSVYAIQTKMSGFEGDDRVRAIFIKEERAELVKHHLMVLWADYFKP